MNLLLQATGSYASCSEGFDMAFDVVPDSGKRLSCQCPSSSMGTTISTHKETHERNAYPNDIPSRFPKDLSFGL